MTREYCYTPGCPNRRTQNANHCATCRRHYTVQLQASQGLTCKICNKLPTGLSPHRGGYCNSCYLWLDRHPEQTEQGRYKYLERLGRIAEPYTGELPPAPEPLLSPNPQPRIPRTTPPSAKVTPIAAYKPKLDGKPKPNHLAPAEHQHGRFTDTQLTRLREVDPRLFDYFQKRRQAA